MMNDPEIAGPVRSDRTEQKRLVWFYQLPPEVGYEEATKPEFWHKVAGQLAPGHKIEVWSYDFRLGFEAICIEANPHASPPRVDLCFRSILPVGLALPERVVGPSQWVAKQLSTSGLWEVHDVVIGERIQDGLTRRAALELVGILERQAAAAEQPSKAKKAA
jgi:hypothetical protein